MSLKYKILAPLLFGFLGAILVTGTVSVRTATRAVESSFRREMLTARGFLTRMGTPLSPEALGRMRDLFRTDLAVMEGRRTLHSTTLAADEAKSLERLLGTEAFESGPGEGEEPARLSLGKRNFRYLSGALEGPPGPGNMPYHLFILLDEARIDEAKRRTVTPIVWAAGIGVLIILAAGGLAARSFLRRLRTLSEAATGIASGRDPGRVPVEGRDELGRYADAFNRMVDALAESRDRVVHAERMAALGKLASAVAHEIRNPLASIRMTAEVLRPDLAGDDAHEALGLLLNELKRLELFLDEILTLSGKTVIEKDDADVGELVQETMALLQGNLTHLGIHAKSTLAPGLAHVLDAGRVKQVLVNLLLNGAQAAGPGGLVRVSGEKSGDGSLRIEVRDSGPGVDAKIEGRLFEPFFTTRKGGTGLGLAVCRRIAEAHGGRIAHRREGEWTVFGLELPP